MKMHAAAALLVFTLGGFARAETASAIWKAKCKGCHGEDGKAHTKVGEREKIPDFTTAEWQKENSDAEIRKVIAEGSKDNAKMKAFQTRLSSAEIDSLVQFIRKLK